MNIGAIQNVKLALQAVSEHRFRSLLTVLGIVIGITTVVTVASLLTGLREGVVVFFEELGPDNIFLYKTSGDPSMEPPKERKRRPMKAEYVEFIRRCFWCRLSTLGPMKPRKAGSRVRAASMVKATPMAAATARP